MPMDFVLDPPKTKRGRDSKLMVMDRFSNVVEFIPCHKTNAVTNIADLFFREIVRIYEIPWEYYV